MSDTGTPNPSTVSNQRLVWCDCDVCKAANPAQGSQYIPSYLRQNHRRTQNLNRSAIAQRGRGSPGPALSTPIIPPVQRGRATPQGLRSAAASSQNFRSRGRAQPVFSPETHTTRTIPIPAPAFVTPHGSEPTVLHSPSSPWPFLSDDEPMDINTDFAEDSVPLSPPPGVTQSAVPQMPRPPGEDNPPHRNIPPNLASPIPPPPPRSTPSLAQTNVPSGSQRSRRSVSPDNTPSRPSKYLRVIPPVYSLPTPASRGTPIPLAHGQPIPLAVSFPALVPQAAQSQPPRPKRQRRKAKVRAAPIEREEDEAEGAGSEVLQSERPQGEGLGLYDDPDAGDELHNDPLLHTALNEADEGMEQLSIHHDAPDTAAMSMSIPTPPEYPAPPDPSQVYQDAHPEWFGRIILVLVAILHAKHHVSFRACALVLFCAGLILTTLGFLDPATPLPVTLNTVIHRLDLHDRFTIYPICANCHRIFPAETPTNTLCPDCETRLFKPVSDRVFRMITGRKPQRPPPACAAPIQLPSSLLADFLAHGHNEAECDSWKSRPVRPGELHDISDGASGKR
ncbi:hypothetical protein HYDPIDRAFT_34901 [Hydnomerulius pinastri MD-312]|uniref:Uncharacterized protein n=1 Tax=Hydnomerulius pinastri MD-312 TaxID=994086 RepID=A0A0C9W5A0_9AGAM|nr:hypothetical protein HYDPIDRAFT_34901 [Hydnomerulius pinastri MD-312]